MLKYTCNDNQLISTQLWSCYSLFRLIKVTILKQGATSMFSNILSKGFKTCLSVNMLNNKYISLLQFFLQNFGGKQKEVQRPAHSA